MLVINSVSKKPLIFIVDELDRCRPDYSVELLENIKHLFSVRGIVFVLAIDKVQLGYAICGVYGSENINSQEYLRRFIELEYQIPEPDITSFVNHHFDNAILTLNKADFNGDNFKNFAQILFGNSNLNLRQIEQIINHTLLAVNNNVGINIPQVILYLTYCKHHYPDFYLGIKSKKLTPQEILNKVATTIQQKEKDQEFDPFTHAITVLLYCYTKWKFGGTSINQLFSNPNPTKATEMIVVPKLGIKEEKELMFTYLQALRFNAAVGPRDLEKWINRIELTESFKK